MEFTLKLGDIGSTRTDSYHRLKPIRSIIIRLTMSFVNPAEHDEVVCSLACLILADAGVQVNTENIEKVGDSFPVSDVLAPQGHQQHC